MSAEKPYVLPNVSSLSLGAGEVDLVYSGCGEGNAIIGDTRFQGGDLFFATFEYIQEDGSVFLPSKLNAGGPYDIGTYNLLVVVAENGDDSGYNDLILEITWYTPK
ncbi:hypothetical protein GGI35DRAFT_478411 [Trichoderma velutinum]